MDSCQLVDTGGESVHPIDGLIALPIKHRDTMTKIVRGVAVKILGFGNRVAITCEMIEAPRLACADQRLNEHIAISVYEMQTLGCFANAEIDLR